MEYDSSMKVKTSVTLSEDILKFLEKEARKGESRSEVIDRLLRETLANNHRQAREARDLELINKHVDELNQEAEDVLEYQVEF
jgi:Arc/MetJ-type ribon-helix-helix transcriptional regulator